MLGIINNPRKIRKSFLCLVFPKKKPNRKSHKSIPMFHCQKSKNFCKVKLFARRNPGFIIIEPFNPCGTNKKNGRKPNRKREESIIIRFFLICGKNKVNPPSIIINATKSALFHHSNPIPSKVISMLVE